MAAQTASVSTRITSSRYSRHRRKVSSPTSLTAVPENRPSQIHPLAARSWHGMAQESSVCTPTTRTAGLTALT